jgi:DivIVA domain-containing protein
MDRNDIERLRVQGFTVARRGYDQREVDKFLDALTEWLETDAAKDLGGSAVMRKLELAGKSTAQILLTTEKEAEQMRLQNDEECARLRSRAEAASLETRRAADEYARKVREKADEYSRSTGEAAGAKAKQTIEEGESRRAQIETVIGDLDVRRAGALKDLERLRDQLGSTIEKYASPGRPNRRNGSEKQRTQKEPAKEPEAATTP